MIKQISIVLVVAFLFLAGCTVQDAEEGDHDEVTDEAIGPEALQEHIDDVKLLDIRTVEEYELEHIENALSLPINDISESKLEILDYEKDDDIIVYANSDIPPKKARTLLMAMGYNNVRILRGGIVHWKEDGFETTSGKMDITFDSLVESKQSSIVIEPAEYDFGIIPQKGGIVSTIFTLTNKGNEEVEIEYTSTSCGCTSAEISKETILSGESVELEVFFDPDFHEEPQGKFTRTVFLQTSEDVELQAKIHVEIDTE